MSICEKHGEYSVFCRDCGVSQYVLGEEKAVPTCEVEQLKQQLEAAQSQLLISEKYREDWERINSELTSKFEAAQNDLMDALDVKELTGPTALSSVVHERDQLRQRLTAATAENAAWKGVYLAMKMRPSCQAGLVNRCACLACSLFRLGEIERENGAALAAERGEG